MRTNNTYYTTTEEFNELLYWEKMRRIWGQTENEQTENN